VDGIVCLDLQKLPSDKFAVVEHKQYAMSWGPATCYLQVRVNDSDAASERK
jgi:hypothetical protein